MIKIAHLFAIAAAATLGMTACEEKKPATSSTAEPKKEEPKKEEPKKDVTKPAAGQPSAPKPPVPDLSTDEVINAPPDAVPAPPTKPATGAGN